MFDWKQMRYVGNCHWDETMFPLLVKGDPGSVEGVTIQELKDNGVVGLYNPIMEPIRVGDQVWWAHWSSYASGSLPALREGVIESIEDHQATVILGEGESVQISTAALSLIGEAVELYKSLGGQLAAAKVGG